MQDAAAEPGTAGQDADRARALEWADAARVVRHRVRDDLSAKFEVIQTKLKELEMRLRLAEGELRGTVDLSQFGKPDLLKNDEDEKK